MTLFGISNGKLGENLILLKKEVDKNLAKFAKSYFKGLVQYKINFALEILTKSLIANNVNNIDEAGTMTDTNDTSLYNLNFSIFFKIE